MKFSIFSKWMYRTSIIRNLFNKSRAFFHKWLKWRSYSPFAYMLFCNLTPLDTIVVNAIVFFARNPNFVNKLPLYTFNIQFKYDNLNFSFLLWNKLHLYFVAFLLPVSIYTQPRKLRTTYSSKDCTDKYGELNLIFGSIKVALIT